MLSCTTNWQKHWEVPRSYRARTYKFVRGLAYQTTIYLIGGPCMDVSSVISDL